MAKYRGEVYKFIIIPICAVYDAENKIIQEERMKPITHYNANELNLKEVASNLEKRANDEYYSKLEAPDTRRRNRD